ncbi:MAG: hypothetical protein MUE51_13085 [Thermoleophilia bacterium]|jgi:hypothetical protein|nr:hypothetical protein [Thermoleophilia bacterium]
MKGYHTKRITLPGGKVIEIVYFDEPESPDGEAPEATAGEADAAAPCAAPAGSPPADDTLHVCPRCAGDLVYPVTWEERSGDRWQIERRCPNCEWRGTGEFDQDAVEEFDDVLNDGTENLLRALRDVARSNMEADVDRLIHALHSGLIEPIDF